MMGYLIKKVKRQRHKKCMNIIARAALAGCEFYFDNWDRAWIDRTVCVYFLRKSHVARSYLHRMGLPWQ